MYVLLLAFRTTVSTTLLKVDPSTVVRYTSLNVLVANIEHSIAVVQYP
jgi:hypothetical protein